MVTEQPAFRFEEVTVTVAGAPRPLLDRVDLTVAAGGVTAVVGPSGAGKSTLLRLCNRLDVATAGTVRFRGDDVDDLDPLRLRRRVGMVFQRPTLFPGTVRDNLSVADPGEDVADLGAVLAEAGLDPAFLDRRADDLSGGEAQRACLARTLVTQPEVLLMDEPTSSLDTDGAQLIEATAGRLAAAGVAILWVTHDQAQVRRVADRCVTLREGRIVSASDDQSKERGDDVHGSNGAEEAGR